MAVGNGAKRDPGRLLAFVLLTIRTKHTLQAHIHIGQMTLYTGGFLGREDETSYAERVVAAVVRC